MVARIKNPVLLDVPVPVETPRLFLRPVMPGDGAALFAAKEESWDSFSAWLTWAHEKPTLEKDEENVRRGYARFVLREDIWLVGIDKATGMPVIWTGLHNPVWDIPAAGIGYMVRKSAQGRGFATESTNALLRFAFNALGMKRVAIAHAEGNEASAAVIRKLGFHFEAFEKYGTYLPDRRAVNKFSYARFDADGLPDLAVKWGPP